MPVEYVASFSSTDLWSIFLHTRNTSDGIGVKVLMLMCDNKDGMCPFRAPTKHIRDEAIMWTHKPPNADVATIIGIIQAPKLGITLLPNV